MAGGAKKLARLAKAWKYYNSVPVSSFYLEMRAAKYISGEPSFVPAWDICGLLEHLEKIGLAPMNDPKGAAGRFYACSTKAKGVEALSKLHTGATRARKALDAHRTTTRRPRSTIWTCSSEGTSQLADRVSEVPKQLLVATADKASSTVCQRAPTSISPCHERCPQLPCPWCGNR